MRLLNTTSVVVMLMIATILSGPAVANDKSIDIPREFITAVSPSSSTIPSVAQTPLERLAEEAATETEKKYNIERTAAVSGVGDIIVSPVFTGTSLQNQSYLRLVNPFNTASTYTIRVVGVPGGTVYGTATINVPARASPQYVYTQILSSANVNGLAAGDTSYAFYVRATGNAGLQHVIYNGTNKFFENVSMCTWDSTRNYSMLGLPLVNMHTTTLVGYPSYAVLHNYAATTTTLDVGVYESTTGAIKNILTINLDANTSYEIPFSWFQTEAGWTPSASEFHGNLLFTGKGTDISLTNTVVGHLVVNQELGAALNMTQICALNLGTNVTGGGTGTGTGTSLTACTTDFNCGSTEVCVRVGPTGSAGVCLAGCSSDSACGSGMQCTRVSTSSSIRPGVCTDSCSFNTDCDIGDVCVKTSSTSAGTCVAGCTSNFSCSFGKTCVKTNSFDSYGVCSP